MVRTGQHIFASRHCTANRISIRCPSELAVRVAFERIGDRLLRLGSFDLP
jgi:hypothetical protein